MYIISNFHSNPARKMSSACIPLVTGGSLRPRAAGRMGLRWTGLVLENESVCLLIQREQGHCWSGRGDEERDEETEEETPWRGQPKITE